MLVIGKVFKTFDENDDGDITLKELERVLKKSGKKASSKELNTMMTKLDKNGNKNFLQI